MNWKEFRRKKYRGVTEALPHHMYTEAKAGVLKNVGYDSSLLKLRNYNPPPPLFKDKVKLSHYMP